MVKKYEKGHIHKNKFQNHIKADVIILGCSLPGIVTAHNLRKKFGNSMDIMILDLASTVRVRPSRAGIIFQDASEDDEEEEEKTKPIDTIPKYDDNVARYFIEKYANEFRLPVHEVYPCASNEKLNSNFNKLFQYMNGSTVDCTQNFHDFGYLNFVERFELEQFQSQLDLNMIDLFQSTTLDTEAERQRLLRYDRTTMETHICQRLVLSNSREIMRTIVRLVCGTSPQSVSVLFYLHQCHRRNSSRNHIDGDNTRFREKLLGSFRKRLAVKLQQSIADITLEAKPIKHIRTSPTHEQVILEPVLGETDYVCNLLAMALRPDQLSEIEMQAGVMTENEAKIISAMQKGKAMKFMVQYEVNFWRQKGYSGDILSIRGPILWAMERPKVTETRDADKYATLVGYLKVKKNNGTSREAVLEQLVKIFGDEAAIPVQYKEYPIEDLFIPRCGDYVAIKTLTAESKRKYLEWGAMDVFGDGDVASAIQAGHKAYLNLLTCLRPQAITYEDVAAGAWPINFTTTFEWIRASVTVMNTSRFLIYGVIIAISVRWIRSYYFNK